MLFGCYCGAGGMHDESGVGTARPRLRPPPRPPTLRVWLTLGRPSRDLTRNPKLEPRPPCAWLAGGGPTRRSVRSRSDFVGSFGAWAHLAGDRFLESLSENSKGFCFRNQAGMARRDDRAYPYGSVSEEQRRQTGLIAKTLRAAGLLPVDCVGSALAARCGDARASPPCPQSKSLAAEPLSIFRPARSATPD